MPEMVTVLTSFLSYGGGRWKRACDWGLGPEIPPALGASGHEGCAKQGHTGSHTQTTGGTWGPPETSPSGHLVVGPLVRKYQVLLPAEEGGA